MKMTRRARLGDDGGELAQRLRHQPRLQARERIAHLAFDLRARHERGDAIDDDDVDGVAADERVADLERLLAGVRLRDEQLADVDAARLGVVLVERVLDVDVGGDAAGALRRRDDVVGERGLAGALRAVDLGDAAARQAADAEREVEREGAGGDDVDLEVLGVAELHDGAAAVALLDIGEGVLERLVLLRLAHLRRAGIGDRVAVLLVASCHVQPPASRTPVLVRGLCYGRMGLVSSTFVRKVVGSFQLVSGQPSAFAFGGIVAPPGRCRS